ncbi:MAG: TlpA disulfide reductase family protein [Gelidibacter sp.]
MILTTLLGTYIISYIFFKYKKTSNPLKLGLIITTPITLLLFFLSIWSNFNYTITYLIFIPSSCFLAYNYQKKHALYNLLFSLSLFLFVAIVFFPNQFAYSQSIENPPNFQYDGLILSDNQNKNVELDSSKTIVLDFWTTSCGICFKKFPEYEKIYLKYKVNPEVEIYSVNVPLKRDTFVKTVELVGKLNYKFPTLYLSPEEIDKLPDAYGINSYPHLLIIKNNHISYSGRMETNPLIFINNIYDEIDKTLTK